MGIKLIKIINKRIKKLKKIGVLICNKRLITFYKFFKWKTLDKRKILTLPKTTLNIMVFNCNRKLKFQKFTFLYKELYYKAYNNEIIQRQYKN